MYSPDFGALVCSTLHVVYNTFIETGHSVVLTQQWFRNHFSVGHNSRVPKWDTIMKRVNNFQTSGSVRPGTAQEGDQLYRPQKTLKGIASGGSQHLLFGVRHACTLSMSDRSVQRIFSLDNGFSGTAAKLLYQLTCLQKQCWNCWLMT